MTEPRVLYVASEAVPFSKTGGLADVAAALPHALAPAGVEVRVFTPRHRGVETRRLKEAARISVSVSTRRVEARVLEAEDRGTTYYLLDAPEYFDRAGVYGEGGIDYPDNAERFTFFSRAVPEFLRALAGARDGWRPDVIHANDWTSGLVPVYLKTLYAREARGVGAVISIHNLAYQGVFWHYDMHLTGLPWDLFTYERLEFHGKLNLLKGGIVYSDLIHTVSATYAREITTPEFGEGLDPLLRFRAADLRGIRNGVDYEVWDPRVDPWIAARYDAGTLEKKRACKRDLQRVSNLPEDDAPIVGVVSRLAEQKGFDLLARAFDGLMALGVQFVLLGTGSAGIMDFFRKIAVKHPLRTGIHLEKNDELAHKIEAGADLFLMPSRYEPCGLNQLYSMRYGTVPVVRRTGGLAETVEDGRTGFVFEAYEEEALLGAVRRALGLMRDDPARWAAIQRSGMEADFSWRGVVPAYADLYREAHDRARRA